jgi:hypothetical protein
MTTFSKLDPYGIKAWYRRKSFIREALKPNIYKSLKKTGRHQVLGCQSFEFLYRYMLFTNCVCGFSSQKPVHIFNLLFTAVMTIILCDIDVTEWTITKY